MLENALHPGASNPARWRQSIGGVAANVCRAATPHTDTQLIAAVGDDAYGAQLKNYFQSSLACQPDTALRVVHDHATGRYCAVLDQHGELVIGLAETTIADQLTYQNIAATLDQSVRKPDMLVLDANLSHQCLRELCTQKPAPLLAALTVSPVKAMRLADHAAGIDLLFTNRREAAALTGLPVQSDLQKLSTALLASGFAEHVLTDGENNILVQSLRGSDQISVTSSGTVQGVNGAGDALAGASLAGITRGLPLLDAVANMGVAAAQNIVSGESAAPGLPTIHRVNSHA